MSRTTLADIDRHYEQARRLAYAPRAMGRDYIEVRDLRYRLHPDADALTVESHYLDGKGARTYLLTDLRCTCPARRECRHLRTLREILGGVDVCRRILSE